MIQGRKTRSAWKGAYPIFILRINWNGRIYYASTKPALLSSAAGNIQLNAGLTEDPEFSSSLSALGFNVSSYSTPVACYLHNVDLALQYQQGNTLENAEAELSYVLIDETGEAENYDNRVLLVKGLIKEPIIGHRDRFKGYFEASIEAPVLETSLHASSMGQLARISPEELSDLVNPTLSPLSAIQDANYILELLDMHKEKVLPIIFGAAGIFLDDNYTFQLYPATPAYVLYAESGSTNKIWLAVAPHAVKATRCRIYDDLGNFRVEDIDQWVRADGRVFSFVHFTHSSGGFQNPVDDESARYFVSWFDGGGLISPSSNEEISGAGDICLWCLEQGGQEVDYLAWESLRPFLNSYKIAGYVNDQEISAIEFLEAEIIPLLPISVVQGRKGMRPILDLYATGIKPNPVCSILASPEFSASSALQQRGDSSSLINDVTVSYCYDMKHGAYKARQRITGDTSIFSPTISQNQIAVASFNKYGSREKVLETQFVVDVDTAALIASDIIRYSAFPETFVEYTASPAFGWIEIGDILSLTDPDFSFVDENIQIVSKSWDGNSWRFTLKLTPRGLQ